MSRSLAFGVVVFPGSNCDRDAGDAIADYLNGSVTYLWHGDSALPDLDGVIIPGGFSYGDYLRAGALAQFSPVMNQIQTYANQGGRVIGICNGFQVLTECGLLPGALIQNESPRFLCDTVALTVENHQTAFTHCYAGKDTIHLPVAHAEGRYVADPDTLADLEANRQVVFRYQTNVNGSLNQIAGIMNKAGNVLGMMPHPERALKKNHLFTADGQGLFDSLVTSRLAHQAV